jgi:hypothetical protein
MVYSFIHTSQFPVKDLPWKMGKSYGQCPWNPTQMGCSLVNQGDHLWHCCFYPSAMQPAAQCHPFRLVYTRALLARMCHSNFLQCVTSTPVTASHLTQGTDIHITLKYWEEVGFMGSKFYICVHAWVMGNPCIYSVLLYIFYETWYKPHLLQSFIDFKGAGVLYM